MQLREATQHSASNHSGSLENTSSMQLAPRLANEQIGTNEAVSMTSSKLTKKSKAGKSASDIRGKTKSSIEN